MTVRGSKSSGGEQAALFQYTQMHGRYPGISVSVVREWTWLTCHRESISHTVSLLRVSLKPRCRLIQGTE